MKVQLSVVLFQYASIYQKLACHLRAPLTQGYMEPPHGNGYAMKANGIGKCPNICDVNKDASPPGPDGRLSWAIAITCFLINFIAAFFYRCPGMFFNSVMDTFDATRGDASVPVSLYGAFYNMAGLVAGALIGSLGVRPTLILGGVMMAVGFGVSLFATSTLFLVFTVGALAGVGHGMVFSCSIVAVTGYFDKRRGIALGLNMAGPPITSLLVPKLLEWLLGEYGLRGTFLILGGCMANAVNGGSEPFPVLVNRNNDDPLDRFNVTRRPISGSGRRRSTVTSVKGLDIGVNRDTMVIPGLSIAAGARTMPFHPIQAEYARWKCWGVESTGVFDRTSGFTKERCNGTKRNHDERGRINYRIQKSISEPGGRVFAPGNNDKCDRLVHSRKRREDNCRAADDDHRGTVLGTEQPEGSLCSPRMYFHTFSFFTCAFFVDSYLTVMFDLGEDVGVPVSESVLALTILSAMDTVGRFFVPFLTDYGVTSAACLLTLCYVMLTAISALMPCVSGRLVFLAVSALLGLPAGYVLVGTSETLSKELGTKNLPMAYGVLAFTAALGGFARPPVVGQGERKKLLNTARRPPSPNPSCMR
ncbi:hypothetical protein HPB52_000909 [Rhipicephalus sanguineus]|uniref:Monocarboxylate transporter n=1 Tax=Rhipicephalus sanguineus TaxID=34632 RepID=A0A9D4SX94_RHISA|nr:hypothetical protein HPB52_000909 [Rhipicephalus sanguineus]